MGISIIFRVMEEPVLIDQIKAKYARIILNREDNFIKIAILFWSDEQKLIGIDISPNTYDAFLKNEKGVKVLTFTTSKEIPSKELLEEIGYMGDVDSFNTKNALFINYGKIEIIKGVYDLSIKQTDASQRVKTFVYGKTEVLSI